MNRFLLAVALLVCFHIPAYAAEWDIMLNPNDVAAIDCRGEILWWATSYGIVSYDSRDGSHRVYTPEDFGVAERLTAIAVSPDGQVWAGTMNGDIVHYDGADWSVNTTMYRGDRYSSNKISTILFAPDGSVLFGTEHGIATYDGTSWSAAPSPSDDYTTAITAGTVDSGGTVWFGTDDGLFRSINGDWERHGSDNGALPSDRITALASDADGVLWVGTVRGYCSFDGADWLSHAPLAENVAENHVTTIDVDAEGSIWVGTPEGLHRISGDDHETYTSENSSLPDNRIACVLADGAGNVWAASGSPLSEYTPKTGLARFDGATWTTVVLPAPGGNVIKDIAVDSNGDIWAATANDNSLSRYSSDHWIEHTEDDGVSPPAIETTSVDDTGRLWLGGYGGVSVYDNGTFTHYASEDGIQGEAVSGLAVNPDGTVWCGTDEGLYSFDGVHWISRTDLIDSAGIQYVTCISADPQGKTWFGSLDNGILCLHADGSNSHYTENDGLSGKKVRTIAADLDGTIWAGTGVISTGVGLYSLHENTWVHHETDMISSPVTDIAVDSGNTVWIVTETQNAIISYNDGEWEQHTPPWNNGGGYNAITIDHDGVIWLGSDNIGIIRIDGICGKATSVENGSSIPQPLPTITAYPNPFNPSTTISFTLPESGHISLTVYNLAGQKVRTLIDELVVAGNYSVVWDGRDDSGNAIAAGMYVTRLSAGGSVATGKMVLVK